MANTLCWTPESKGGHGWRSCKITYVVTTHIQRYWLDPGSRAQSVSAAILQGKDKLYVARDLKLFCCELGLCTLKTKRHKCCLVIQVKGKVFPQQMGRERKHCLAFSSSISSAPWALNEVSAGKGRVTAFPAVHTKGHFAPVPSEWKFALCKSSSSPQPWSPGGWWSSKAQARSGWNQHSTEEEEGWRAGLLQSSFISFNL